MPYSRKNLQRVGPQNANAPALFTFKDTGSTLVQIDGSGFFNDASDMLKIGDLVYVQASNGYGLGVITGNTRDETASPPVDGVVDMTNVVALGAIDSD